ncbi:MAG: 50S ribosomal protein L11 methyltransferase [Desulfovibrionaceae bacterium]
MSPQAQAYTPYIQVQACNRLWELERAADLESLWEAMTELPLSADFVDDERLPYWTELWPASVALAQWLYQQRDSIAGKACLDLGCGLGLTAMVGQWLGAQVLAMDYEEAALRFARKNAVLNNISQPLWTVMDWRRPAVARGSIARVWGGDIMYETRFVKPVLDFLEYSLAPQGRAWVAEPCRTVYEAFRAGFLQRGWSGKRVHSQVVDPLYAQPARVTVHVWELCPPLR